MRLILDIATILGGISAAWFLWERLFRKAPATQQKARVTGATSYQWLIRAVVFFLFASIGVFWVIGQINWGWNSLAVVCAAGILVTLVGGILDDTRHGNDFANEVLIFGGALLSF